jgi:hypothetical protein
MARIKVLGKMLLSQDNRVTSLKNVSTVKEQYSAARCSMSTEMANF